MQTRRLLIMAPLAGLVGTAVVAAVIASGQRTLAQAVDAPHSPDARPGVTAELLRVDAALAAAERCAGPIECDVAHVAARVDAAAEGIARWPSDSRYVRSRARLHDELVARHAAWTRLRFARADGRVTRDEQTGIDEEQAEATRAARARIRAQHDAGLLDDARADRELARLDEPG